MRQALPKHLDNPFNNRFNYPVTQRLDEMQSYTNVLRMRERHEGRLNAVPKATATSQTAQSTPIFGSILALLFILLVSVFMLLKAF